MPPGLPAVGLNADGVARNEDIVGVTTIEDFGDDAFAWRSVKFERCACTVSHARNGAPTRRVSHAETNNASSRSAGRHLGLHNVRHLECSGAVSEAAKKSRDPFPGDYEGLLWTDDNLRENERSALRPHMHEMVFSAIQQHG